MTAKQRCDHLSAITTVKQAKNQACEECIKTGDSWVYLGVLLFGRRLHELLMRV